MPGQDRYVAEPLRIARFSVWLLALISCINIVILNFLNVPSMDDWCNTMNSWQAALMHPFNLYISWTGRFVSSAFLGVFLYLPAWAFVVVNTAMTLSIFLCCIILGSGKCSWQKALVLFSIAYLLIWFFVPSFGEVMLWRTGSIVYLWTTTALLAWLVPYRLLLEGNSSRWSAPRTVAFAAFSLMAGNGMEHTSFCVFLMASAILLVLVRRKASIPAWAWWGLGCLLAGWILLMAAPGNYARAGNIGWPTVSLIVKHSLKICKFLLEPFIALPALYVIGSIFYCRKTRGPIQSSIAMSTFFIFFGILNMLALIPTPLIVERALAPSYFIILCGILSLLSYFFRHSNLQRFAQFFTEHSETKMGMAYISLAIVLLFATSSANTIWSYYREANNYASTIKIIEDSKRAGNFDISLPESPTKPDPRNYYFGKRLSPNATYWGNACFARCYGLNSITFGYERTEQ